MANVKDLKGNIIITDGKTIKDMKNEAELDKTATDNENPETLFVFDDKDGANFCTECGSRNIYCVSTGGINYQIVCHDCGHKLGFRTKQDIDALNGETDEKSETSNK